MDIGARWLARIIFEISVLPAPVGAMTRGKALPSAQKALTAASVAAWYGRGVKLIP